MSTLKDKFEDEVTECSHKLRMLEDSMDRATTSIQESPGMYVKLGTTLNDIRYSLQTMILTMEAAELLAQSKQGPDLGEPI